MNNCLVIALQDSLAATGKKLLCFENQLLGAADYEKPRTN